VTATSWLLLAVAGVIAVVDWWAAGARRAAVEALVKPAVIVALAGVALTLTVSSDLARWLVLFALACSLVGDVALLRSDLTPWFAAGLAAFLLAHLGYLGAMVLGIGAAPLGPLLAVCAGVVVLAGFALVGRRIVAALSTAGQGPLVVPVSLYIGAISLMVVAAWATGRPAALAGAIAFYASDSLLGWDRFVQQLPHRSLAVLSTYHLGQVLLVLSLAG
jgi:alkenylglycerophosphocholine/alkenylglycerophosphoethanolamine hydrolase